MGTVLPNVTLATPHAQRARTHVHQHQHWYAGCIGAPKLTNIIYCYSCYLLLLTCHYAIAIAIALAMAMAMAIGIGIAIPGSTTIAKRSAPRAVPDALPTKRARNVGSVCLLRKAYVCVCGDVWSTRKAFHGQPLKDTSLEPWRTLAMDYLLLTASHGLLAMDYLLWTTCYGLLWTAMDCLLWTTCYGLLAIDCLPWTACYGLLVMDCSFC